MVSAGQQRAKYVIGDFLSSIIAWSAYTYLRYTLNVETMSAQGFHSLSQFLSSRTVMLGMAVFPIMMMCVYCLSGYYNDVFRKSRVQELFVTMGSTLFNSLVIFFVALVNDMVSDRAYNYEMILLLILLLFVFVYSVRATITARASKNIKNRKWQFNTLIVGVGKEAKHLGQNLNSMPESIGNRVVGYVAPSNECEQTMMPNTYRLDDIEQVCARYDVSELIVAMPEDDKKKVLDTINNLFKLNLPIKITPTMADIVLSHVMVEQLAGEPLVDVMSDRMSDFSHNMKRVFDVLLSILLLLFFLPLFAVFAVMIKMDSPGPVVYRQKRIGLHNKPFWIYKFRSMVVNAESDIPQLSTDNDERVTKVGRWMRKYRLDETLQFWNVIKGDMSLVGPRPEREYYLNQMMKRVPYCALLHRVRPGITSLGMVKYGYAKNVDEMIERLKYDLLYLENMSLINDLKILIYTVKIVFNGRGI